MLKAIVNFLERVNREMRGAPCDDHASEPQQATRPRSLTDDEFAAFLCSIGIEVQVSRRSWRCGACSRMQHADAQQVYIPDGTRTRDPMWAVVEKCRRWAYNGSFTAWCLKCCRSFTPMTDAELLKYGQTPHDPIPILPITFSKTPTTARPFVQGMTIGPGESVVLEIPLSVDAIDPHVGGSSE